MVTPEGHILTASHVILGAESLKVTFSQSDAQRTNFAIPVDLILQVNGVPVESRTDFYRALWRGKVGDPFELIVRREDQNLSLVVRGGDRQAFFASPLQAPERTQ